MVKELPLPPNLTDFQNNSFQGRLKSQNCNLERCCSSHLYSLCPKDMQLLHIIPSSSCLEVPWKMAVFVPRRIYNLLQPRRSELPGGLQLKYFVSLNDIFCLVQSRFTPKFKTTALSRLFNVIFALIPID